MPFQLPVRRNILVLSHGGWTLIRSCFQLWFPVLDVFVLKARGIFGETALFAFDESWIFLERWSVMNKGSSI